MKRVLAIVVAAALATAFAACGGDDDDGDREAAEDYALAVEEQTDEIDTEADRVLTKLNELAEGSANAEATITALELANVNVDKTQTVLDTLEPPDAADISAQDLKFFVGDLSTGLDTVATDIRVAARTGDEGDASRNGARLILAEQSAVSALSRAVRNLAVESAD